MHFLKTGTDVIAENPDFELIGRDDDLLRLQSVLMRSKAASVLLVGPGGVGATALIMGLQKVKERPDAPFDIVSKRLFWLQHDDLFSSGNSQTINESFAKILGNLRKTPDSILIIEDAKDFIEGARNSGNGHFINSINSAVKSGHIQVILEARDDDLDYVLKSHSDMVECYTMLDLAEPTGARLMEIVTSVAKGLEKHHGIKINLEAVQIAVDTTSKYRTRDMSLSRAQPERSLNLLDRALSSFRLKAHTRHPLSIKMEQAGTPPEEVKKLDEEFIGIQNELKRLFGLQRDGEIAIMNLEEQIEIENKKAEERHEKLDGQEQVVAQTRKISAFSQIAQTAGYDNKEVARLKLEISKYQTALGEHRKKFDELTADINSSLSLSRDEVMAEFSRLSGIPVSKLNEDEREKLRHLEAKIKERLFGQDAVVEKLANAVKVARVGRKNDGKPQAAFLFMGPSGVGKTEIAKALAQNLLDDEAALTRFDMSEYMEKHAVAKLIGAPPGYEGFEVGGILTNAMRKNPHRVILFDEIEKAHPDVFNLFLQILSDGRLTDNVGRTVSFSEAIILMTTNIGQPFFLDSELSEEEAETEAKGELDKTYRSEFLNRFAGRQNIICFKKLGLDSIEKIVLREIKGITKIYEDKGITVEFSHEDLVKFCKDNYDPRVGARGLPGYIQTVIEPVIVNTILNENNFVGTVNFKYSTKEKKFSHELKRRHE